MKRKISVFVIFILTLLSVCFFQNRNLVQLKEVSSTDEKSSVEGVEIYPQGGDVDAGGGAGGNEDDEDSDEKEIFVASKKLSQAAPTISI